MMVANTKIILAVSGSIAAYKAVYLLRLLKKAGAEVRVVCTESVGEFVNELTFSSLSGHKVFSGLWSSNWSEHVELGTWADLMIVAPATANTLAKLAHGLCDNALTAVYLAARCPVVVAPAMDVDMFQHPRTQANLQQLREDGVQVLPTGSGFLASGLEGPGRLLEPEEIFAYLSKQLGPKPLAGKRLLLTAGPTREAIDPVRYITNHSSGKMGYAIATEAQRLGARVTLISGPVQIQAPHGVQVVQVQSAQDMYEAVHAHLSQQDIIIMSAAVADYTPATLAPQKLKKQSGPMELALTRTQDILQSVGEIKAPGQLLVGFALETENELENAQKKLHKKKLDFVVLNSLQDKGAGFGHDTNKITLIDRTGQVDHFPLKSKNEAAQDILQKILSLLGKEPSNQS